MATTTFPFDRPSSSSPSLQLSSFLYLPQASNHMDRLVAADVKELEINFKRGQKSSASFRLTNLMHTMPVAVSLISSNPTTFSFLPSHLYILPPLSTSTFSIALTQAANKPPICCCTSSAPPTVTVRSSMLPTGKASVDEMRKLFGRPGRHVFKDAILKVSLVGRDTAEWMIRSPAQLETVEDLGRLRKVVGGCGVQQLSRLLRIAVENGKRDFARVLIDAGADVNRRDLGCDSVVSESLILAAVQFGGVEIVQDLIAAGIRIGQPGDDLVLHEAVKMNDLEMVQVLVEGFPGKIDVNSVDGLNGRNALHVAAQSGNVEALRFLISIGADADAVDVNGYTPLHFAAAEGQVEAVEMLLESCSFSKYAVGKDKKTAFMLAVENGYEELYDMLHISDALLKAASLGNENGIKRCVEDGVDVNGRDQNGWTALHRAAFKGRIESVKLLVASGAQVDDADDAGYTPLHCAVEAGHAEVAMFLVAHGAKGQLKSARSVAPNKMQDCLKAQPAVVSPLICKNRSVA